MRFVCKRRIQQGEAVMSENICLKLPDGKDLEVESGIRVDELAAKILPRMKKKIIGAVIDNEIKDLRETVTTGGDLEFLMQGDERALEVLRHSASHLMAEAVLQVFPDAALGIGPSTADGFYYDFKLPRPFEPEDIAKIEKLMNKLAKQNNGFERDEMPIDEAIEYFKKQGEEFKVDLIEDLKERERQESLFIEVVNSRISAAVRILSTQVRSKCLNCYLPLLPTGVVMRIMLFSSVCTEPLSGARKSWTHTWKTLKR